MPVSSGGGAAGGASATGGTGGTGGAAMDGAGRNGAAGATGGQGMGGKGSAGGGQGGSAAGSAAVGGLAGNAAGGSSGAPSAGSGGTPACEKGTTKGDDVLLIGDSFIALSRDITKDLNTLARNAGALEASDAYRDKSVSGTQLSGGISPQIPQQYINAQKETPVKIVIMDGGGNDMLNNTCSDPPMASCQAIQNAVTAVKDLFVQMGKDGVESVVYFFYPENQKNATQRAKVDVLRSELQEVCKSAASPKCYGVDLRPVFEGHFTEYVLSDGIHPTAAGSRATAEAIWSVMQQNCVAQ
jgi:lysophospholipase L1-like esterase